MQSLSRLSLAIAALSISTAASATAQDFTIRRLLAPGFTAGIAEDMDNSSNVVGAMFDSAGRLQPVIWTNGNATMLPLLPGGNEARAITIDDSGTIGGECNTATTGSRAVKWQLQSGAWVVLDMGILTGDFFSRINDAEGLSTFAGFSDDGMTTKPVVWTSDADVGSPVLLPTIAPFFAGQANAMTSAQDAVGNVFDLGGNSRPALWTETGGVWSLSILSTLAAGGSGYISDAIGNADFVGHSDAPGSGARHLVRWNGATLVDRGTLGTGDSFANAGNAAGVIVGDSTGSTLSTFVGVRSAPGQAVTDMNTLLPPQSAWTLTSARGINDAGAIVGSGNQGAQIFPYVMIPTQVVHAAPTPGVAGAVNTFSVSGVTPGGSVSFLVATTGGQTDIPGCLEGLDIASPQVLGTVTADAAGNATFSLFVRPSVAGIPFLFQAYDLSGCHTSNVVEQTF